MARVFISFAIEDKTLRDFLVGQKRNARTPIEFTDYSVKEAWSSSWKTNCRQRINGCRGKRWPGAFKAAPEAYGRVSTVDRCGIFRNERFMVDALSHSNEKSLKRALGTTRNRDRSIVWLVQS